MRTAQLRRVAWFYLFLSEIFRFHPALGSTALSLDECITASIKKNELVPNQDQQISQIHERIWQAKGNLFPNLSANATYFIQQSPSDPLTQSFFPSTQPNVKFSLTQPIFRGLREFATLRQLNHLSDAQENTKAATAIQLASDVTQSFFTLLSYEQELKNLSNQIVLYDERIQEIRQRVKTGQSSMSDSLTTESSKAVAQAQIKHTRGLYRTSQESFTFLTGLPQDTPLFSTEKLPNHPLTLQEFTMLLENRPDIKAARQKLEASEAAISNARGAHLPTIDFQANYYLIRPNGVFSDIRWDLQLNMTVPIFAGGVIQSQVKEVISQKTQSELSLARAVRQAEQEIRTLFESFQADLEEMTALEQSMELSEKNYYILKKDYTRGLTRTIEVLQAFTQFQESKRLLDKARYNALSDLSRLRIVSTARPLSLTRK